MFFKKTMSFFFNEFSVEIFQLTLPRSNRGITIYAAIAYNVLPKYNELNIIITPRSMFFRVNVVLAAMKITWILLYFSITFLDALSISGNISKGIFLSEQLFSTLDLNTWRQCCKQVCCHPGFIVSLAELRQNRFSLILKGFRIFQVVRDHWLPVICCISPYQENQPVLGIFEAKHWLLLSRYQSPGGHLLPIDGYFVYTGNLWFSGATFIDCLS